MKKFYVNVKISFTEKRAKLEICEKENLNKVIFWFILERDLFLSFFNRREFEFMLMSSESWKKNRVLLDNWKFLKINNFKLLDTSTKCLICTGTIYC